MNKAFLALLLTGGLLTAPTPAMADVTVGIGITPFGFGIYAPPVVYPGRPYYSPPPVVYLGRGYWGERRGYRGDRREDYGYDRDRRDRRDHSDERGDRGDRH